jgi:hypothetical protein
MRDNKRSSMTEERREDTKLTLRDIWELTKDAFAAMLGSALVFILPYMLFTGAFFSQEESVGSSAGRGWLAYIVLAIVLYFVISNLEDFLNGIGRYFTDAAKFVEGKSFIKKAFWAFLFVAYSWGWAEYTEVTLFATALLMIPALITYDKYKRMLERKAEND